MKMNYTTGTTTLALKYRDGVVLAADTRVTAGYLIAHKKGRKIHMIKPYLAVTIAGVVADAQVLIEQLRNHLNLYENMYGRPLSLKAAANYLSLLMYSHRLLPFITEMIIAGKDRDGYKIFKLDPLGSVISDDYMVSGSGSMFALGVLENEYRPDLTEEEAVKVALKALAAAMKRDIASGDDFMIAIIDDKGFREVSTSDKTKLLSELELRT